MTDWNRISENMVQDFIFKNEYADERELVLQHKTLFDLPAKLIAEQIAGRRKAKRNFRCGTKPKVLFIHLPLTSSNLHHKQRLYLKRHF